MLTHEDQRMQFVFNKVAIESKGKENEHGDIETLNMVFVLRDHNEYYEGIIRCMTYSKPTVLVLVGREIPILHAQMLCEENNIKLVTLI